MKVAAFSGLFLAVTIAAALKPLPKTLPTESPSCREFFHDACSEALGRWLPVLSDPFASFDESTVVKRIAFSDAFIYENRMPQPTRFWGLQNWGPPDGTFFVYGNAGPPKGRVVYDYAHEIAFYDQGCCAWHEVVLTKGFPAPPKRVVDRDLTRVRTVRGIALGQPVSTLLRIYGTTKPTRISKQFDLELYRYYHTFDKNCGQGENFVYKNGRLVYIQLANSC